MTPEERKLVTELFDRLVTLEDAQRDPEAERLIRDGLRQAPNAPYALVQTVLLQDEALKRANARLREFEVGNEGRNTSFLGEARDTLFGARESRGSVPSVRPDTASPGAASGMSPAWRAGAEQTSAGWAPPPATPFSSGGSFLGTAASTAAGVIGGALLLDGIRSMMGHRGAAHAALDPVAAASSPWSSDSTGGELARQAGLDDISASGRSSRDAAGEYGLTSERAGSLDAADDDDDAVPDDVDDDFDDGVDSEDV